MRKRRKCESSASERCSQVFKNFYKDERARVQLIFSTISSPRAGGGRKKEKNTHVYVQWLYISLRYTYYWNKKILVPDFARSRVFICQIVLPKRLTREEN